VENHGYSWEFLKNNIELKRIPKKIDYFSICKFHNIENEPNNNLQQYLKTFTKVVLEINDIHVFN
jgi:hypothetical protein